MIRAALPITSMITIKLEARISDLYKRLRGKNKNEQGGEWLFSTNYHDKFKFVKKLCKKFEKIPADIAIDSSKPGIEDVYKTALENLNMYTISQF